MNNNFSVQEIRERVIKGLQLALERLLAKAKAEDKELVVSDENGNPIRVKARSLK